MIGNPILCIGIISLLKQLPFCFSSTSIKVNFFNLSMKPVKKENDTLLIKHTFLIESGIDRQSKVTMEYWKDEGIKLFAPKFSEAKDFQLCVGPSKNPKKATFRWNKQMHLPNGYEKAYYRKKGRYCEYDEEDAQGHIEDLDSGCHFPRVKEDIDLPVNEMKWASGSLWIKVKTMMQPIRTKLVREFCPILSPPKTKCDFKIISSDGSAVKFHKSYLINLSESMKIRLEDDSITELKVNFSTKSLDILRDLMYGLTTVPFDETIDKFDLDFLKFSRFLRIQPFYNLVKENIIKKLKLDEKNFTDVIKVADELKEEALFEFCFNFLKEAKKKSETPFHEVEYWKVLAEENPSLYAKIKDIFEF